MSKEKKSKKKIKVWMIVVAIVAVLLVVGVVSMVMEGKKAMEAMAMDSDDIYTVEKQDLKSEITTSGTVVGIDQIAYTSPVTAKVEDIKVEVGQTVHEGEMLLIYDAGDLGDDLAKVELQAKSEKAAGNASYEAANKAAGKASDAKTKASSLEGDISAIQARMTELNTIISTYELEHPDNSQAGNGSAGNENENAGGNAENSGTNETVTETVDYATYQSATVELESLTGDLADKQAELSAQQAIIEAADDAKVTGSAATQISVANQLADMNVSDAQKTLDAAEAGITAKKKGIVTSVDIIKGAYAAEAQTLMTIVNADDIGVEFVISKDDLGIVKEGQKARVVIAGKEYEGTVSYVSRVATMDNAIASTTATVKGKITLDNPDDDIFIGVAAKVYLFIGEATDTLAVPYQALNSDVDGDYVYTVNEENIIERKDVKIGLVTDEYYEIIEGLKAEDRVITNVTKDMKPGDEYVPVVNPMVVQ